MPTAMSTTVTRDMGMTHQDFYRLFPAVANGAAWRSVDNRVTLAHASGPIVIELEPQGLRKIAGLTLPTTVVRFKFPEQDGATIERFMARFDQSFRRGGG